MNWKCLANDSFVSTGGNNDYFITFFRKGLKQVEIFVETNWHNKERGQKAGMNIGTLTPEIIAELDEEGFPAFIQGDYYFNKEFDSYEEAMLYAKKYCEEN